MSGAGAGLAGSKVVRLKLSAKSTRLHQRLPTVSMTKTHGDPRLKASARVLRTPSTRSPVEETKFPRFFSPPRAEIESAPRMPTIATAMISSKSENPRGARRGMG